MKKIRLSVAFAILMFAGIALAAVPGWFNSEEYLKANPDVAGDAYYGSHPYEHFLSSGYPEGRTWAGDPKPPTASQPPTTEPTEPIPGTGSPETHTVWVDKFSGYEHSTQFSTSGDNPQFQRFGAVEYGYWPGSDRRYVYNTRHIDSGVGHVEYHPELTGRYEIRWYFRKTENRAKTAADVRLVTAGGTQDLKAVSQYSAESDYTSVIIGTVDLTESDYIQVMPGDRRSISFGKMVFTRK
ncbi:hypothetical protein LCGC14_1265430 [marine sediment metagenome]|uniref:Malectin domain-containing protein n=1 Tax=marine sediment metagenome TaxID=412755 RepID=A0A0F9P2X7_9ZZZZ|nr:hypothetical protein [Desulfobacterales bacterium]